MLRDRSTLIFRLEQVSIHQSLYCMGYYDTLSPYSRRNPGPPRSSGTRWDEPPSWTPDLSLTSPLPSSI
jgi:hypothetical protein